MTTTRAFVVSLCLGGLLFPGCTRYAPRSPKPISVYLSTIDQELSTAAWLTAYRALPEDTPAQVARKTNERNRLINEFLWTIDSSYNRFEVNFYAGTAEQDIGVDWITLGLSTAGTLTLANSTKTILSAAASAVTGGKASFDAHWLDKQTRYAIVAQMQALRATALATIQQGMRQGLLEYSLDQGIRDCQTYYEQGSVVAALQAIASSAGAQATAAKQLLRSVGR
jgi:hypothetical protein